MNRLLTIAVRITLLLFDKIASMSVTIARFQQSFEQKSIFRHDICCYVIRNQSACCASCELSCDCSCCVVMINAPCPPFWAVASWYICNIKAQLIQSTPIKLILPNAVTKWFIIHQIEEYFQRDKPYICSSFVTYLFQ